MMAISASSPTARWCSLIGKPKVTIVDGDDWIGLYLDGVLVEEGHSLHLEAVLRELQVPCHRIDADQEWLEEMGRLPVELEDVKRAA